MRKRWTEAETERLRELAAEHTPAEEIAAELGRSTKSVYSRAHIKKIKLRPPARVHESIQPRWSEDELAALRRAVAGRVPTETIAAYLGPDARCCPQPGGQAEPQYAVQEG